MEGKLRAVFLDNGDSNYLVGTVEDGPEKLTEFIVNCIRDDGGLADIVAGSVDEQSFTLTVKAMTREEIAALPDL